MLLMHRGRGTPGMPAFRRLRGFNTLACFLLLTKRTASGGLLADAMDLNRPPKDIFQAAARNDVNFIKRTVERTLEFDM